MLCWFLLHNKVNPMSVHPPPPSQASRPLTPPPLLGRQRALRWAPCVTQQLRISCLHAGVHICQCHSLTLSARFFPHCVHKPVLYICIFIPALYTGSSAPFFEISYTCIDIWYLFFSFCIQPLSQTDKDTKVWKTDI